MRKYRLIVLVALLAVSAHASAQCVATKAYPPGNNYFPIKEIKTNLGKGLVVEGYVRTVGDCKPVAGARVGHWQPDAKGVYDDNLRAYTLTDRNGHYQFSTVPPGSDPRKIHFMVIAKGYKTLITEWVDDGRRYPKITVNLIVEPGGQ